MKRFAGLGLAAVMGLGGFSAGAAEFELQLSHWVPAKHPIQTLGIEPWVKAVEEASGWRIKITIFPAQQLGAAADHYDMARDGIVDISYINPGYQAGRFPIYSLLEVPFNVKDSGKGAVALHEWYAKYMAVEMPDVKFCMFNPHDPGTLHSRTQVKVPADVKGLNVRPAHATMARFVSMLGGAPIQVPAPEAREALAKGTADAITFPWNSVFIFGVDKETKYHLDMPFYISSQALIISKASVAAMPADLQKVIDDHCTPEWSGRFSQGWAENEYSGRQKMIDSGVHVLYTPSAAEVALWREAAKPVLEQWKKDVTAKGYDAETIHAEFIAALDRHGVRY
jgi:TRAP-type C4-dicarboxylate transport system substrate-binding protein